jgi:diaminopimelate epimerase
MTMDARRLRFEKWEGLGNDFIVLAGQGPMPLAEGKARELCDRRRGVGGDGVLLVDPISGQHPRMTVFNADGSRPEMCGNGLRCVAAFLVGDGIGNGTPREVVVSTDAGDKRCLVERVTPGLFDVTVEMGVARITGEIAVTIEGCEHRFHAVDVGNPHAITFAPYEEAAIDRIGPVVATSVPGGVNVELCRVHNEPDGTRIEVIVWERGVGRTLACGTGACAVAAAACETGRAPYGAPIRVGLPGGDLVITVGRERRDLIMRGPARRVFAGEVMGA